MPPSIGAAIRLITSEPVPLPQTMGTKPARITATVIALCWRRLRNDPLATRQMSHVANGKCLRGQQVTQRISGSRHHRHVAQNETGANSSAGLQSRPTALLSGPFGLGSASKARNTTAGSN